MDFIVEKISEDSFYINLLLGLPQLLETMGIKEYNLERYLPTSESEIIQWEHKYGVVLPDDLHDFYSSVNGFLYEWYYIFKEKNGTSVTLKEKDENALKSTTTVGKIEVNSLENLKQIFGYVTSNEPGISNNDQNWEIKLSLESKVFEICSVAEGKVVLVYLYPKLEPSIWFFTCLMNFYYLSKDFKTYLKMCIAHIAIPNWQFAFTSEGISEWTKSLFRLFAPNLLPETVKTLSPMKSFSSKGTATYLNKIDPMIFNPRLSQLTAQAKLENYESSSKQINNQEKQNELIKKHQQLKYQRKPLYYIKKV